MIGEGRETPAILVQRNQQLKQNEGRDAYAVGEPAILVQRNQQLKLCAYCAGEFGSIPAILVQRNQQLKLHLCREYP